MKRTTLFVEEDLESDLKTLARRRAEPLAVLVREALTAYVVREKGQARKLPGFAAVGRSGHLDTAERHEDLLFRQSVSAQAPAQVARVRRGRRSQS